ncbi:MAG: hypothetical protein RL375_3353 [Pseudomonadota bacterium]
MLQITRSGRIADAIASVRDVPARVIPYAAATALTRTAKIAQTAIVDKMPAVFKSPTRYTLNATRIDVATVKTLSARVAVKDQASSGTTAAQSYLKPEVFGGSRNEKRFEKALRLAGALPRGMWVLPGAAAKLDASGNLSRATISKILTALKDIRGGVNGAGQKAGRGKKLRNELFVGVPTNGRGAGRRARPGALPGVYRREGTSKAYADGSPTRRIRPLMIFTNQRPSYGRRLDFDGVVQQVALDRFRAEFERAAADIVARRR